jgi:hypothetical protein
MNRDEEKIDLLLSTKVWEELSPDEKVFAIQVFGSEEQYVLMRKIGQTLVSERSNLSPDPKIFSHLATEFGSVHPPVWKRVVQWRVPAYAIVVPIALIAALVWWPHPRTEAPAKHIVQVADTVYIKQSPDTVFIQRTVIKYLPQKPKTPSFTIIKTSEQDEHIDGVNMKENEELEKLLVSGS